MKIGSLVAEFNPFHNGHKYLIDEIRKNNDAVIAIMSGNFVQRGECAVFDKQSRTLMALKNGVDLVLELPALYALSSAEGFAFGAIQTLIACGCVDELWFGSECGDISLLASASDILREESTEFKKHISESLEKGYSFPYAKSYALEKTSGISGLLNTPNNVLGIEYISALNGQNSKIKPFTLKRAGSGYNDCNLETSFPSASAIRKAIEIGDKKYLSQYQNAYPMFLKDFDMIISARLKVISESELYEIPDCNDEIAARLKKASVYNTVEEILSSAVCRRYTLSRIRRILCNMIISNKFKALPAPSYIRPLGFNSKGGDILKLIKQSDKATLPVISRGALLKDNELFALECRSTDIYNLAQKKKGGEEFSLTPIII